MKRLLGKYVVRPLFDFVGSDNVFPLPEVPEQSWDEICELLKPHTERYVDEQGNVYCYGELIGTDANDT